MAAVGMDSTAAVESAAKIGTSRKTERCENAHRHTGRGGNRDIAGVIEGGVAAHATCQRRARASRLSVRAAIAGPNTSPTTEINVFAIITGQKRRDRINDDGASHRASREPPR